MRTLLGAAGLALMAVGGLLVWDQATHWDVLIWLPEPSCCTTASSDRWSSRWGS